MKPERSKAWLDGLRPGDAVAFGRNRWDKNKTVTHVKEITLDKGRRIVHLDNGQKFPHSLGDANLHRSGQVRTWIGPAKNTKGTDAND